MRRTKRCRTTGISPKTLQRKLPELTLRMTLQMTLLELTLHMTLPELTRTVQQVFSDLSEIDGGQNSEDLIQLKSLVGPLGFSFSFPSIHSVT